MSSTGSFYYEVPVWSGPNAVVRVIAWRTGLRPELSTLLSGPPLHIRSGVDNSLTGVGWDRPDLVGVPYREHHEP